MKKLTGPMIKLYFMKNNSIVVDTTHGLIHFPHVTMQVKTASSETIGKPHSVIIDDALTIPPSTTRAITASGDHPSEWNTTGTVTPLEKFTEIASLLISHFWSTRFDKRIGVRVNNTTKSQYLIKKNTQIAEFSVVTPEQSKHIKPVDMAIYSMIPPSDPDLTAYLSELPRMRKPEQQNKSFWFPTAEISGKFEEDHIPIQKRILKDIIQVKGKNYSINKRAENPESISLNNLIGLTHF